MMFVVVKNNTHISIKDHMRHEIIYSPNDNDLTKTFIPPYNGANIFEKSV